MNRSRLLWLLSAGLLAATAAYAASPDFDSVLFKGATSGTATLAPQATAGTPTITLPTTSGTLPTTATSPLVLNATTGALSCPTCGTGSGTVSGPGSSTAGHVATWNNTGGTILADGGALATVATTGSAADLGSGTLAAARLPAFTGDVTTSAGSAATTLAAGSASNLNSGTLAAARGGAGTISGALKGNGSGVVSQAACADLSNATASCATDATNATNIASGTLSASRLPTITGQVCATWDSTLAVTAQTIEFPIPWATYTVASMKSAVSGGGSFTVAAKIGGTNITSLSAVSVSGTTNTSTTATGANTGVANDQITLVVSSPSGTVNQAYVCLVITHSVN